MDHTYATAKEEIDSQLRIVLEEIQQANDNLESFADDIVMSTR